MSFSVEVLEDDYPRRAAQIVAGALPRRGTIVLTGGRTAAAMYPELAEIERDWSQVEVFFSDERCVAPEHAESNYAMARRSLLDSVNSFTVHRMHGEDEPETAAASYAREIGPASVEGIDLVLLGMGADCHICALFPGSPGLAPDAPLCMPVDRPDGLKGLTLTPRALLAARRILLLVTGSEKAGAVARALDDHEDPTTCPVRTLADHPAATFVLDRPAAARL